MNCWRLKQLVIWIYRLILAMFLVLPLFLCAYVYELCYNSEFTIIYFLCVSFSHTEQLILWIKQLKLSTLCYLSWILAVIVMWLRFKFDVLEQRNGWRCTGSLVPLRVIINKVLRHMFVKPWSTQTAYFSAIRKCAKAVAYFRQKMRGNIFM
jgi:hypothetical protein